MDIARQGGEIVDVPHMPLAVEDGLIEMCHRPALGDIKLELLLQGRDSRAGDGGAPIGLVTHLGKAHGDQITADGGLSGSAGFHLAGLGGSRSGGAAAATGVQGKTQASWRGNSFSLLISPFLQFSPSTT